MSETLVIAYLLGGALFFGYLVGIGEAKGDGTTAHIAATILVTALWPLTLTAGLGVKLGSWAMARKSRKA